LIKHSIISRSVWIFRREETEHPQPVLDGDQHDVVLIQDVIGLVFGGRATDKVSTMYPNND
jgi:hypothetical protein